MRIINGIPASGGFADGKALLYLHHHFEAVKEKIEPDNTEKELLALDNAFKACITNTEKLLDSIKEKEQKEIVETHLIMLQDPEYNEEIKEAISIRFLNACWAVESVTSNLVATLQASDVEMIRDRAVDFIEISELIIGELSNVKRPDLSNLDEDVILIADSILPTEMLTLDRKHVKAIGLDTGGRTSHVAIFARSLNIPTILGLGNASVKTKNGDEILVDGNNGRLALRPEWNVFKLFEEMKAVYQLHMDELKGIASLPSVSPDSREYTLCANIETADEIPGAIERGAAGIGLFRSEFLYLQKVGAPPNEEEQFEAYKTVIEGMQGRPVTIRTIDVGGDKAVKGMGISEENPILGWRAVRFCLERKDIFRIQLRALLRSSLYGQLHIMFPMISGIDELDGVLFILEQVKQELRSAKIPFDENVKIGTMIEVPSAALISDELAKKVDFFSIGTNDLIQYTIAVDRGNEKIAYLYQPFHPGVLRLIKMVIDNAHKANIPVGMCGEMAGDPFSSVLLAGLGLDEFSMSPSALLEVRKILRETSFKEAQAFATQCLTFNSSKNIDKFIREWMHDRFDHIPTIG
jgi:phosphotransferase system enzyme I (PtsI)